MSVGAEYRARPTVRVLIDDTDELNLCAEPCAPEFLADHGVPGAKRRNRTGQVVAAGLRGARHALAWMRRRANGRFCDLCGDEWQSLAPGREATRSARSEQAKARYRAMTEAEREAVRMVLAAGRALRADAR